MTPELVLIWSLAAFGAAAAVIAVAAAISFIFVMIRKSLN